MSKIAETQWLFGFQFLGFWMWSLGFHIDPSSPNIEIHIPFGFIVIGRRKIRSYELKELIKGKGFYGIETKCKKYESKNNNQV